MQAVQDCQAAGRIERDPQRVRVYLAHANALKDDLTVTESLRFLSRLHGFDSAPAALAAIPANEWGPNPWHVVLFLVVAIVMRGAGCTWNDLVDRDIDALVEFDGDGGEAVPRHRGHRLDVAEPGDGVLDPPDDLLLDGPGAGAGVGHLDGDDRQAELRVLLQSQAGVADDAEQDQQPAQRHPAALGSSDHPCSSP